MICGCLVQYFYSMSGRIQWGLHKNWTVIACLWCNFYTPGKLAEICSFVKTRWVFPKTKIYRIYSFIADHSFFIFCSNLVDPDRQREMRPQTMDISAYSCPDVPHNYHVYALPTCYSIDEMTNYRDIYEWWIRDIQLWSWKLYQLKPRSWRPIDPSILIILWVCGFLSYTNSRGSRLRTKSYLFKFLSSNILRVTIPICEIKFCIWCCGTLT